MSARITGRPVHACTLKKRKKLPRSDLLAAVRPKKSVVCGQKASSKKSATLLSTPKPSRSRAANLGAGRGGVNRMPPSRSGRLRTPSGTVITRALAWCTVPPRVTARMPPPGRASTEVTTVSYSMARPAAIRSSSAP